MGLVNDSFLLKIFLLALKFKDSFQLSKNKLGKPFILRVFDSFSFYKLSCSMRHSKAVLRQYSKKKEKKKLSNNAAAWVYYLIVWFTHCTKFCMICRLNTICYLGKVIMEMLIFCHLCWINEENDFDLIVLIKFTQPEDIFKLDLYFT